MVLVAVSHEQASLGASAVVRVAEAATVSCWAQVALTWIGDPIIVCVRITVQGSPGRRPQCRARSSRCGGKHVSGNTLATGRLYAELNYGAKVRQGEYWS